MTAHEMNLLKINHGSLILLGSIVIIAFLVIKKIPKKLYYKIMKKSMEVPVSNFDQEDFDKMGKDTTKKIFRKILLSLNEDGWKRDSGSNSSDEKYLVFRLYKKEEGLQSELTVYIYYSIDKTDKTAIPNVISLNARIESSENGFNSFEEKTTDSDLLKSVSKFLNKILDDKKNKAKKANFEKLKKIENGIDLTFKGLDTSIKRDDKLESLLKK